MERKLTSLHVIREILAEEGLSPQKRLGQNFLVDFHAREAIVAALGLSPGERVLEIGPGLGALTEGLIAAGADLVAIEVDRGFAAYLQRRFGPSLQIVVGDALEQDFPALLLPAGKIAGNLPYYISTPLIAKVLEAAPEIAVLLLQEEVAQRLRAGPGEPSRGALSVLVEYAATVEPIANLRPEQFYPRPQVHSQVVRLRRRPRSTECAWPEIRPIVRAAFGFRRKIVRGALQRGLGLDRAAAEQALERAAIDPGRRGETLALSEFDRLAGALRDMSNS